MTDRTACSNAAWSPGRISRTGDHAQHVLLLLDHQLARVIHHLAERPAQRSRSSSVSAAALAAQVERYGDFCSSAIRRCCISGVLECSSSPVKKLDMFS